MSGEGDGDGDIKSHQGFGYIGEDDDEAGSGGGGSPTPTFDAVAVLATTDNATYLTFNVTATSTGTSQTNGQFTVQVTRTNGGSEIELVPTISTDDLDGWTETGWTNDGLSGDWFNTYTKASIALNEVTTVAISATLFDDSGFFVNVGTTPSPPIADPSTDQASGSGDGFTVTLA